MKSKKRKNPLAMEIISKPVSLRGTQWSAQKEAPPAFDTPKEYSLVGAAADYAKNKAFVHVMPAGWSPPTPIPFGCLQKIQYINPSI
jgi:hypothetical protein